MATEENQVSAFDAAGGTVLWHRTVAAPTTDGRAEAIVWSVGADGDNRLHGVDGDTGQPIFDGGGPGATMARIRRYQTPVAAKGRIFVAGDERVYAFRVP